MQWWKVQRRCRFSQFDGVALIDRHKLVNASLAPYLNQIHALSIKAWTPAQWKKKNDNNNNDRTELKSPLICFHSLLLFQ
jgi:hypothetical protein